MMLNDEEITLTSLKYTVWLKENPKLLLNQVLAKSVTIYSYSYVDIITEKM